MYPKLVGTPVEIFVEANLSHDLAAFVEKRVKMFYKQTKHGINIKFVKQYDSQGKLLPGVLTRHKANLVSYFKRVLDEGKLYICRKLSTVSKALELSYKTDSSQKIDMFPTEIDAQATINTLSEQATLFRCYQHQQTVVYSGKRNNNKGTAVDDMLMALITAVAWARLPQNTYIAE